MTLQTMKTRLIQGIAIFFGSCVILIALVLLIAPGELVSKDHAIRTAESAGFKNPKVIRTHGASPRVLGGCSHDEAVGFDVRATNPAGVETDITVCCGFVIKNCKISYKQ